MVDVARSPIPRIELAARRHWLTGEVARRLREDCGVQDGPLVLGVSGGADSVALLLACCCHAERGSMPRPVVVHVNHQLREDAEEDGLFVENLCETYGVRCVPTAVFPDKLPGNIAENARTLRYEMLATVARDVGAPAVAVAHHGDDQLETMLMALCRGTGADGLTGMPWRRTLADGIDLVRPLLAARTSDCEAYCRAAGVTWRTDPSNHDRDRARARLRQDVIPVLEELWPDAARRATGAANAVDAARTALETLIDERFGPPQRRAWKRRHLADLPAAVVAAGLRRAALDAAPDRRDDFGRRLLDPAVGAVISSTAPKRFDWPAGLCLRVDAETVELIA
jgi:tRNA(Ile)-lysidine synthetase-like protein